MMLFTFKRDVINSQTQIHKDIKIDTVLLIFGITQLVLAISLLVNWLFLNGRVYLRMAWEQYTSDNKKLFNEDMEKDIQIINNPELLNFKQLIYVMDTRGPYDNYFKKDQKTFLGSVLAYSYFYF